MEEENPDMIDVTVAAVIRRDRAAVAAYAADPDAAPEWYQMRKVTRCSGPRIHPGALGALAGHRL